MYDVLIITRPHGRCIVIGETPKGQLWIQREMVSEGGAVWITREGMEEVVKTMEENELRVDVK